MNSANIDDALSLVTSHFRGLTDKDGEPYVMHCLRVMMGVASPDAQLVALMHDLVEDTPVTIADLKEQGFSSEVLEALDLVTHKDEDSYAEYIIRLKENPISREVKLSDLRDNAGMTRVLFREEVRERDARRIGRYILSYQFLTNRLNEDAYRRQMRDCEES